MSEAENASVPAMIRQGQLADEIAAQIPQDVEGEWEKLIYTHRAVSMYAREMLYVHRPDGSVDTALAPLAMGKLVKELRSVMYRPGVGAWFTAEWTLVREASGGVSVDVEFNYDDEPSWGRPISPSSYAIELEDFPRDEENTPNWLEQKVAEAQRDAK
ncbi:agglutinin cell wall attachment protein [Brachybacterium vulturis]|uniref:agglutinin cell wall attachment protein n=1 Tax=Brachybacterium vulturis TaxID=2017484 RepID=UPI0012FE573B|nr:agglutinin cell wall attachment protein [Brachybacterium vulturis]